MGPSNNSCVFGLHVWARAGQLSTTHACSCPLQAGDLQNAMVRIGSKLEQGEAQKHSLEYQLTLSQKDCRQHLDLLEQREKEWNTLKQSFQGYPLSVVFS